MARRPIGSGRDALVRARPATPDEEGATRRIANSGHATHGRAHPQGTPHPDARTTVTARWAADAPPDWSVSDCERSLDAKVTEERALVARLKGCRPPPRRLTGRTWWPVVSCGSPPSDSWLGSWSPRRAGARPTRSCAISSAILGRATARPSPRAAAATSARRRTRRW